MTFKSVIEQCERQISLGNDTVMFLIPGKWGKKDKKRIWPKGPVGVIVSNAVRPGYLHVRFDAKEVLEATKALWVLRSEGVVGK